MTIVFSAFPSTGTAAGDGDIPEELSQLYARSAVLMDADSGRVLFGKDEDVVRPMASTTKIMTCILALENMQEDQVTAASDHAASQPKVRLGVKGKEEFRIKDLLYSLMLESHNDSAVVIAEGIAGSVEAFAGMMNEKAEELGCSDTYFVTPNGLDGYDEGGDTLNDCQRPGSHHEILHQGFPKEGTVSGSDPDEGLQLHKCER